MSVLRDLVVACPSCDVEVSFEVVESINADRRPDLREAILARTFQHSPCEGCGTPLRVDPDLTYLHVAGRLWMLVRPAADLAHWEQMEEIAREVHGHAYGAGAPPVAQAIGQNLDARITFGWPAFREKLLAAELGIDDVALELAKMLVLRSAESVELDDAVELRLVDRSDDTLVLAWVRSDSEEPVEFVEVPEGLVADLVEDPDWADARAALTAGLFVDLHRILVPAT